MTNTNPLIITNKTITENTSIEKFQHADDAIMEREQLSRMAMELNIIKNQIKALDERRKTIEAYMLTNLKEGVTPVEFGTVTIKPGRRMIDTKKLEAKYPVASNPHMYDVKPKTLTALVKQMGEQALDGCITTGKPIVDVQLN